MRITTQEKLYQLNFVFKLMEAMKKEDGADLSIKYWAEEVESLVEKIVARLATKAKQ